jgi:hypothetical protein
MVVQLHGQPSPAGVQQRIGNERERKGSTTSGFTSGGDSAGAGLWPVVAVLGQERRGGLTVRLLCVGGSTGVRHR